MLAWGWDGDTNPTPADLRINVLGWARLDPTLTPGMVLSVPWLPGPAARREWEEIIIRMH